MLEIGKYNKLKVLRSTPPGLYLGKEDEDDVVLLPTKFIPKDIHVGDELEVFLYKDSEDRLIATTQTPKIKLNEFACLEVVDINSAGAFLNWGLDKDLLVPFGEQLKDMREGQFYLVYLFLDKESDRLVATSKIDPYVETENLTVNIGDKVNLLIGDSSPLGVNVIINGIHKGLIYHNEIFKKIYPGQQTEGYIKQIRENNKIDVSLEPQGYSKVDPGADIILEELRKHDGFLNLNDKSDPEEIMSRLQMSKKTFKKAVGLLYKQMLITIEEEGIYLRKG